MLVPVTSFEQAASLRNLPRLAVDLGFSGREKSCGVAFRSSHSDALCNGQLTFSQSAQYVVEKLDGLSESLLIVEAPLSAAFNGCGNPCPRGEFERVPRCRWWSIGAGAAMALAAQYFLRECVRKLPSGASIYLIEGFVSGIASISHREVAESLLAALEAGDQEQWHTPIGHHVVSVLEWLGEPAPQQCPIVLIPDFS